MRIKTWEYVGVTPTGIVMENGSANGSVKVTPGVDFGDGCDLPNCNCSDGLWMSVNAGRDADGTVRGMTVYFDTVVEMDSFVRAAEAVVSSL